MFSGIGEYGQSCKNVFNHSRDAREESFLDTRSIMAFARSNFSRRLAMILLYNLPIVDVKAIGLNELGSVAGPDWCTRIIFPTHHEAGQV